MTESTEPVILPTNLVQDQESSDIFFLKSAIGAAMSWLPLKHPLQGPVCTMTEQEIDHECEESYQKM